MHLVKNERRLLDLAVSEMPAAFDSLRQSLTEKECDAVYRLVRAAYYIGGMALKPWFEANADKLNGQRGAGKSVKTRENKADEEYRNEALMLANHYIAMNPGPLNIAKTAQYIDDHIKSEHVKSLDTYKRAVKKFRDKKLLVGLPD